MIFVPAAASARCLHGRCFSALPPWQLSQRASINVTILPWLLLIISAHCSPPQRMPAELPPIHLGDNDEYKQKVKKSRLSREALDAINQVVVEKAAARGVTLIMEPRAAAAAEGGKRKRAAAVSSAASVSSAAPAAASPPRERAAAVSAAAPVSAAAAVSAAASVSSRGRPLIEKRQWPEGDD